MNILKVDTPAPPATPATCAGYLYIYRYIVCMYIWRVNILKMDTPATPATCAGASGAVQAEEQVRDVYGMCSL